VTCAGARHAVQRSNRVKLKADAAMLLDRIVIVMADSMPDSLHRDIMEMRIRLQPPVGQRAPKCRTGFTK